MKLIIDIPENEYLYIKEIYENYKKSGNVEATYSYIYHGTPLEQELCEGAISRQAVIDTLDVADKFLDEDRTVERYKALLTEAYKVLLPPVTPQPKMGHWTNGDEICPCCGKSKFEDLDADIWADWQPKYCPNCGAKMESEGE